MKQNFWGSSLKSLVIPVLVVLGLVFVLPGKALAVTNGKITFCEDGENGSDVFVMDADGSNRTQLTNDGLSCYPSFAPNGSKVMYWWTGAGLSVGMINPDGSSNQSNLFSGAYTAWLPDSSRFFFADLSSGFEAKTAKADGTDQQPLDWTPGVGGGKDTISFSPDGSKISYANPDGDNTSIYVADNLGANLGIVSTVTVAYFPVFSADGDKIYFVGSNDPEGDGFSLYSVDIDGSDETELQSIPGSSPERLLMSPDGSKLLYISNGSQNSTHDAYTMNIDGTNQTLIVNEWALDAAPQTIGWSPDGTKLLFPMDVSGSWDIFTINSDGTGLTNITNTPGESEIIAYTTQAWGAAPESGGSDSDNDGISDTVENNGPNGGDANNDGIQDSEQAYVSSFVDSITGEYAVLAVSDECTISSVSVSAESANSTQDQDFSYPAGLMDFTLDCGTPGFSTDISQYYYGQDSSDFLIRKYNPSSKTYTTIDGAEIADLTIASKKVVKASYTVKDGGSLDLDNTEDGNISDPSGLASQTATLADTGQNTNPLILISSLLLTSGLTQLVFLFTNNGEAPNATNKK